MFWRLDGTLTLRGTLNDSPTAWPGPWYGSCPITTTFTCSNGQLLNARKTCALDASKPGMHGFNQCQRGGRTYHM
eukprot:354625-Chlamydomonas_euryale.AAC.3